MLILTHTAHEEHNMATKKVSKITDPFANLRPKSEEVPVGDNSLTLSTSKMHQETDMLSALSELDLGSVFKPLGQLLAINADGETSSALDVIPKIAEKGPELWSAARVVLGKQLSPAMTKSAVILLDTRTNREQLLSSNNIPDESPEERDDDGCYVGCSAVRVFVKENITLIQASNVLSKSFQLNGYSQALGKLIPLAAGE